MDQQLYSLSYVIYEQSPHTTIYGKKISFAFPGLPTVKPPKTSDFTFLQQLKSNQLSTHLEILLPTQVNEIAQFDLQSSPCFTLVYILLRCWFKCKSVSRISRQKGQSEPLISGKWQRLQGWLQQVEHRVLYPLSVLFANFASGDPILKTVPRMFAMLPKAFNAIHVARSI